jgi:hypothetical protein
MDMISRRFFAVRSTVAVVFSMLVLAIGGGAAMAQQFPFDQVLVLEAPRMGQVKRVPVLTIGADGRTTVDLWCKTVPALFEVNGPAIRIQTAPLPEALPLYMSSGQCSPERMQADVDLLAMLTQVSEWQRQGDRIVLSGPGGPAPLRFRLSSH